MSQNQYPFPTGFLWGTATSSHQVEGNNTNNDWSAWENQPDRIKEGHRSGQACDWWGGRWREDFARAAESGQNAHRLSLEWSRIQPAPGEWDEAALEVYRQMVSDLVQRGITPMVTLHHFTNPLWLMQMGGWENDETPKLFETYVRKVVDTLKDYVTLWCPINEPNVYIFSAYIEGEFPPGKKDLDVGFHVLCNLVRGHGLAYATIHAIQPQARVGIALNYRSFRPARKWFPPDRYVANTLHKLFNEAFPNALVNGRVNFIYTREDISEAADTIDFFGLNYYTGDMVEFVFPRKGIFNKRYFPKNAILSETGSLAHYPEGMYEAIRWANRFGKNIIITENGIEDSRDALRPRYTVEHLYQVWRAIQDGYPVKGYLHWSLVDNFEWERGWTQRFGLWGLDINTQERIRRPSVDLYATICKTNSLPPELIEQYKEK